MATLFCRPRHIFPSRRRRLASQPLQDRTLRPLIAMTLGHQTLQAELHLLQFGDLLRQGQQLLLGQPFDILAAALSITPQIGPLGGVRQTKAQVARLTNESELMQRLAVVVTITSLRTSNPEQQPQGLIVPNHLGGHPAESGHLADGHHRRGLILSGWLTHVVYSRLTPALPLGFVPGAPEAAARIA